MPYPNNQSTIAEQAADWVIQLDLSEGSASTRAELEAWLALSAEHLAAFEHAQDLWDDMSAAASPRAEAASRRRGPGYQDRVTATAPFRKHRRPMRYAIAAAICLAVVGSAESIRIDIEARYFSDAYSAIGEIREVSLPDGTHLHLNSNSAVDFNFSRSERQVKLIKGGAAFDIAPGDNRPFVVQVGDAKINDIGTVFQVSLNQQKTTVGVSQGQVQIVSPGGTANLSAGQKILFSEGQPLGRLQAFDSYSETAWQRGHLIFVERPLDEVLEELSQYSNGYIVLKTPELGSLKVNGVFNIRDPDHALEAVEQSLKLRSTHYTPLLTVLSR